MSTKETKNNLHREKWEKGREKNSKRSALTYYFHQKLKTQSKILHHFQQSIKFSTKSSINLHIITSHLLHKLIFIKPNTTSLTPSRNLNNNDSSLHFSQTMHQFQQTIYKTTTIITKPVVQIENIITKSKVKEEGEEKKQKRNHHERTTSTIIDAHDLYESSDHNNHEIRKTELPLYHVVRRLHRASPLTST